MNPNCEICHGHGWHWVRTNLGHGDEMMNPCPECNPTVRAAFEVARETTTFNYPSETSRQNRHEPKVRYQQEWLGEKLIEDTDNGMSPIPCIECGNDVIEFSVPNDIWNRVIRPDGHEHDKEYLCMHCFLNRLRTALELPVRDDPFRK
jgi:hypothetical protein